MKPEIFGTLIQLADAALVARNRYLADDPVAVEESVVDIKLLSEHIQRQVNMLPAEPAATSYLDDLSRHIHNDNVAKGFWDTDRNPGEVIALMHSELSEALEAYRHGNPPSEKIPGFSHAEEEFADLVIRVLDWAGGTDLRLDEAIAAKLEYNRSRPPKHGKEF